MTYHYSHLILRRESQRGSSLEQLRLYASSRQYMWVCLRWSDHFSLPAVLFFLLRLLLPLFLLFFFFIPLILFFVQKLVGKINIPNSSIWIRKCQSDWPIVNSCTQMVINIVWWNLSLLLLHLFLFLLLYLSPFLVFSFAAVLKYNICTDSSKKKGKMWFLESSCLNLILMWLLTNCVILGQLLNICDLYELRKPISSYYGRFKWNSTSKALNVLLAIETWITP